MKRHTFLFLFACLLTAVLTVPALGADSTALSEVYRAEVRGTTAVLDCSPQPGADYLALAAYDADESQIGFAMVPANADGETQQLSLTAQRKIEHIKLYQLKADLSPVGPAQNVIVEEFQEILPESSSDIAYVVDKYEQPGSINEDGVMTPPVTLVRLVLADGTQVTYPAAPDEGPEFFPGFLAAYYLSSDGQISVVPPTPDIYSFHGILDADSPLMDHITENTGFVLMFRDLSGNLSVRFESDPEKATAEGLIFRVADLQTWEIQTIFVLTEEEEPPAPEPPDTEPEFLTTLIPEDYTDTQILYLSEVDPDFEGIIASKSARPGDTVNFYRNADGSIDAEVLHYQVFHVTGKNTDLSQEERDAGHSFLVELDDGFYEIYDDHFADFRYDVGSYILAVLSEDETRVLASEQAEVVTGKLTAIREQGRNSQYKINNQYYTNISGVNLTLKEKVTVVLNRVGQIAFAFYPDKDFLADFAYVERLATEPGGLNEDGFPEPDATRVWLILPDGTSATYLLSEDTAHQVEEDSVIRYRIERDGRLTRLTYTVIITNMPIVLNPEERSIPINYGTSFVQANNKTKFVFLTWDEDHTLTATTATGVRKVNIDDEAIIIYDRNTQTLLGAFVYGKQYAPNEERPLKVQHGIVMSESYQVTDEYDSGLRYLYQVWSTEGYSNLPFAAPQTFSTFDLIGYTIENDTACLVQSEMLVGTVESLDWEVVPYGGTKLRSVCINGTDYALAPDFARHRYTIIHRPDVENSMPIFLYDSNFTVGARIYFLTDRKQAICAAFFPILEYWNPNSNTWDQYYPT